MTLKSARKFITKGDGRTGARRVFTACFICVWFFFFSPASKDACTVIQAEKRAALAESRRRSDGAELRRRRRREKNLSRNLCTHETRAHHAVGAFLAADAQRVRQRASAGCARAGHHDAGQHRRAA